MINSSKHKLAFRIFVRPVVYFVLSAASTFGTYWLIPQFHETVPVDKGIIVSLIVATVVFMVAAWRQCVMLSNNAINDVLNHGSIAAMKALMYITENVSHELSTPLEVIIHKTAKIERRMKEVLDREIEKWESGRPDRDIVSKLPKEERFTIFLQERGGDVCIRDLTEAMKEISYIVTASEQISNILRKMKGFKSIKYSNGDKTIYDIAQAALETLAITHGRLRYEVDERLQCFGNPDGKLTNSDLLSILINHLKNSIEAGATQISIVLHDYGKDCIHVDIVDNGSGIPEALRDHIFEPNITSKGNAGIRGNGMYINQQMLRSVGGDVWLVSSGKGGTIIRLRIPSEERGCRLLRKEQNG